MMEVIEKYGAPWVIRTPDLLVRSQTLYPAELRAHGLESITCGSCAHPILHTLCIILRGQDIRRFGIDSLNGRTLNHSFPQVNSDERNHFHYRIGR